MTAHRAVLNFIAHQDHNLMRRMNRWQPPRWIRTWMLAASRAGDGWLWYSLGLLLLVRGGPQRFAAVAAAALAAVTGIGVFTLVKRVSKRKRPCAIEEHCWATLLPPDQFSFPSGHTITACAVVVPLILFYPEMMPGLIFSAASVAISRVVLGMHFLSDVVAGAAIGSALGYVAFQMFA